MFIGNRIIVALTFFLAPILTPGAATSASLEPAKETKVLTIFAASSVGPAIEEIADGFGRQTNLKVRISIASSAALARQIEKGAPADIFISADRRWIRYLQDRGRLSDRNVSPVATNRLVVAALVERATTEQGAARALLEHPDAWIAIGDPALSPLGAYTMEALRAMKIEAQLSRRLAFAADARATMAFLQTGGAPLAILYESDARSVHDLGIVARLDPSLHRPIVYFAAAISDGGQILAFLDHLTRPAAQRVLAARGFGPATAESGQE
ncbi:MAG: molybdate ABC transporter substrate-binding protein [Proteobacteria bacterium]|nr:molybdate ABC transporter substrate-binding protein [Pseudomonadota bacterium]